MCTELPGELSGMLVEMDIVNTPEVKRVREGSVLMDSDFQEQQSTLRSKRAGVRGSYIWPNHRIPYQFHRDLCKYV